MSDYLEKKLFYCQDQREKFRKDVEICRGSLKGESRKLLKSEVLRVALQEENERLKNSVDALHAGFSFKHLDDMERVAHVVRQELRIVALVKEIEELKGRYE